MGRNFHAKSASGKICLGSTSPFVMAFKAVCTLQLALWLVPISSPSKLSPIYVAATFSVYTNEVSSSSNSGITNLAFPSVLGGSDLLENLYSTLNATGIMAIGAALLAAGGIFALKAMPDPQSIDTQIKDLAVRFIQKPPELPKVPFTKGHITFPKYVGPPLYSQGRKYGDTRGIGYGSLILPPMTIPNYNNLDALNPFLRQDNSNLVWPSTTYYPPTTSITTPTIGYTNIDPLNSLGPATTTRNAPPPTKPSHSNSVESGRGVTSDVNLGLSPGPPYRDFELKDWLKSQLKAIEIKSNNSSKLTWPPLKPPLIGRHKNRPKNYLRNPINDGARIISALRAKTRPFLKPVLNTLTQGIPGRIRNGWDKTFGERSDYLDVFDSLYNDADDEIRGPLIKDNKYHNDNLFQNYDYYEDKDLNSLSGPFYVTDDTHLYSKPKSHKSPLNRMSQTAKDYNYDYNYDYAHGNYPRRLPKNSKTKHEYKKDSKYDTSRFY